MTLTIKKLKITPTKFRFEGVASSFSLHEHIDAKVKIIHV